MTEGTISEMMLDLAWKGIEETQQVTYKIDEKANNTITLSALLMTIVSGILVGLVDKIHPIFLILVIIDLILLCLSLYYAMKTIWLKKQEILDIKDTLGVVNTKDYLQSCETLALSIAGWQIRAKQIHDEKNYYLRKSMKWLMRALVFLIFIAVVSTILKFIFSLSLL